MSFQPARAVRARTPGLAALLLGLGLAATAHAGPGGPAPSLDGVVSLSSTATVEVPRDWMSITFSTTRDGTDASGVQAAVRQAVDAALGLARQVAKGEGRVAAETGAFSLQPRYTSKGTPAGWTGRGEIVVQGRDMAAIAQLAGHITTLVIDHVDYTVSREAREKVEGELAAQAIARFRAKASDYAKAFGYSGYGVREVAVATNADEAPGPRPFLRMKAAAAPADESLPVEAGKGSVTATVNGSVQMK